MNLEAFHEYCLTKPGAQETTPFGPDNLVFKVAGKMFALLALDEVPAACNLKCDPDLALELRDRYEEVQPGYHMSKKHWNTVVLEGKIPERDIRKMIDHSYQLVVQSLPKAVQAKLQSWERPPSTQLRAALDGVALRPRRGSTRRERLAGNYPADR